MAADPQQLLAGLLNAGGLQGDIRRNAATEAFQNQQSQQALQLGQMKLAGLQQAQSQEAAYQADIADYFRDPKPQKLQMLAAKYPEHAEALKQVYTSMDADARSSRLSVYGGIYNAARNGRSDLVTKQLEAIKVAEQAKGIDTSEIDDALQALKSGDKSALPMIQGFAQMHMAAIDPAKFSESISALAKGDEMKGYGPGNWVFQNGKLVAKVPFEPKTVTLGQGETAVEYQPGGGDPASDGGVQQFTGGWTPRARNGGDNSDAAVDAKIAGAAQALGVDPTADISSKSPLEIAKAMALSEGGPGSLADRNNNPANLRNSDGSYKKFPTKEAGLQAAAALVARKVKAGQSSVQSLVEGLPSGGGARVIASGGAKPGYRLLTPAEIANTPNLDSGKAYQISPDGQISAIGGQQAQLKAWPATALTARASNTAALSNIEGAIKLVDPKNDTAEARAARAAVGPGTGMLGNTFTNWNDPKGTPFRATIGQIGGIIIKDTSGAAVSLSEDQRLAKWVPLVTDSVPTIRAKLANLKRELAQRNQALDETYTEDQGFRPFKAGGAAPAQEPNTVRDALKQKYGLK